MKYMVLLKILKTENPQLKEYSFKIDYITTEINTCFKEKTTGQFVMLLLTL